MGAFVLNEHVPKTERNTWWARVRSSHLNSTKNAGLIVSCHLLAVAGNVAHDELSFLYVS